MRHTVAVGRTREGARISLIVPSKLQRLDDPTILLKWNVWVLTRAVHNPYVQVGGGELQQVVDELRHARMRVCAVP